jgi:hypothetical protein
VDVSCYEWKVWAKLRACILLNIIIVYLCLKDLIIWKL